MGRKISAALARECIASSKFFSKIEREKRGRATGPFSFAAYCGLPETVTKSGRFYVASIVLVEAETGTLTRYEIGGSTFRKTHCCWLNQVVTFTKRVVENFRLHPSLDFAIEPGPQPTPPNAGAGTVRKAA